MISLLQQVLAVTIGVWCLVMALERLERLFQPPADPAKGRRGLLLRFMGKGVDGVVALPEGQAQPVRKFHA